MVKTPNNKAALRATPGIYQAADNQPTSGDGGGRVRPNFTNLAEPTTPDVENAASSLPHRDDDWRRRRPKYAGLGENNTEADCLSRHKLCSEGGGETGSATETASPTKPALQGGEDPQTWTVATHIFGDPTRPQGEGDVRSLPIGRIRYVSTMTGYA